MLPARWKRYVGHDGRIPRLKTLTWPELLVGVLMMTLLLALMFPRDDLIVRITQADLNDQLTQAYLANLAKAERHNTQVQVLYLRTLLASMDDDDLMRKGLALVQKQAAVVQGELMPFFLQRVESLPLDAVLELAPLVLETTSQDTRQHFAEHLLLRLHFYPVHDVQRQQWIDRLLSWPEDTPWSETAQMLLVMESFRQKQVSAAFDRLNIWWQKQPMDAASRAEQLSRLLLGYGEYLMAAQVRFWLQQRLTDVHAQKQQYLLALDDLMAGNLYEQIMPLAGQHLGALGEDVQVLRQLVQLAQATGQSALAGRYARQLLEMGRD